MLGEREKRPSIPSRPPAKIRALRGAALRPPDYARPFCPPRLARISRSPLPGKRPFCPAWKRPFAADSASRPPLEFLKIF